MLGWNRFFNIYIGFLLYNKIQLVLHSILNYMSFIDISDNWNVNDEEMKSNHSHQRSKGKNFDVFHNSSSLQAKPQKWNQKCFLLPSTHVEWYDDLGKKTLATLNSHSVLNLLQAAREKSLKVKYFEFRRKIFWKEGNENKIFNVVKNSASYPWKIVFFFLSGNSNFLLFLSNHRVFFWRGLTPPKKNSVIA